MFFSFDDFGITFHLFTLQHALSVLVFAVLPCCLILIFKNPIRKCKFETVFRISTGVFGLLLEFGQYTWCIFSGGKTDWREIIATTLCGLSLYLSCYAMITLSKKIMPILYFYSFGAVFSFLLADINHGYDRFRYYTFFIIHGLIIFDVVYLRLIHHVKSDRKAFINACLVLAPFLILSMILNQIFDMNFFYMSFPPFEDFPVYQQLHDLNRYLYSTAVLASYYILLFVMYGLSKILKIDHEKEPVNISTNS